MSVSASRYTSSPWALGLCDRCGFPFRLNELFDETYDERPNGLRVCAACLDVDQPQLQLGRVSVNDPQSLFKPRPDIDELTSTSYFGWAPVGNPITKVQCQLGILTIRINGVVV